MYGLRNPWRIAFDPGPDLIYIADVGENRREELNVVPRSAAGSNFSWNVFEGSYCRRVDCTAALDTTVLPSLGIQPRRRSGHHRRVCLRW